MITSLYRIITIGRTTLTEAVRQKVLSVLLIFGLVLVSSSVLVSRLATPGLDSAGLFAEQIKFVKDFGCGAIGLFGFFIALLSTAQLIPQEIHNRTIYTILAKPVRRSEFLLGKFFGIVLLLSLCVALMSLAFTVSLYWQETVGKAVTEADYENTVPNFSTNQTAVYEFHRRSEDIRQATVSDPAQRTAQLKALDDEYKSKISNWDNLNGAVSQRDRDFKQIEDQVRDPQLIEAVLLLFAKLIMTSAIGLLISTFATSSIFTIITTFMIYLIGHMEGLARDFWMARGAEMTLWQSGLVGSISLLIPDLNSFTIVDEILSGNRIPWSHALNLIGYADIYIIVLLAVSVVIFDYREL